MEDFLKKVKKNIRSLKKDRLQLLLFLVFMSGILLRVLGVYPGYSPYHPDEGKAGYSSAWYMFINQTLDLPHYHYPALIPTIELIFQVLLFIPLLWIKLLLSKPDLVLSNLDKLPQIFDQYIAGRSDVTLMYFSRYLTTFVGALTIILTYLISKKLFKSRLTAVLSALVLAVNLRAVLSSQLDLPDAYAGFFLLVAFYIFTILKDRPTARLYILTGVTVGMAISAKLQFFSLVPLALIHLYHAFKVKGWSGKITTLISKKILFLGVALAVTVVLVNIGPLTHWQKFMETITRVSQLYGFGFNKFSFTGLSYFYYIILTPAVVLMSLLGVVVGLLKYKWPTILVLSIVIPYLYYFLYLTRGWFYPRNFVSVIPFLAILAGLGLASVWSLVDHYVKNRNFAFLFFVFIIFFSLFESTKNSLTHTISYMKPWNITTMRACIGNNVLEGKTVAAHPTDKYILFSLPSIDVNKRLNFIPLNIDSTYALAELQSEKADYALVGLDVVGDSNSVWWMAKTNFWTKPTDISKNTFVSLAARQFFEHTVCSTVKPWQAVENNYVFVKVPPPKNLKWKQVESFSFDSDQTVVDWKKIDGFLGLGNNLIWDSQEGNKKLGSLKIKLTTPLYPVVRWISPPFTVKGGMPYKAEAFLKGGTGLDIKRRDGFLRLDFYSQTPLVWDEGTPSLSTSLSARYFGPVNWQAEEVVGMAPAEAKLATVSFQISNFSVTDFWVDDVAIFEGLADGERWEISPAVVDEDVFVPNLGSGY